MLVPAPVSVSAATPFAAACEGPPLNSRISRGSAVEPMLAANPNNPQHLVAAWIQDRIANSSGLGVLTAVSDDGGATWTQSAPVFSRCAGGGPANGADYARAADPWVAIASNGDVYAVALAGNPFSGPATDSAILVAKSTNGGLTWQAPVAVSRNPVDDGFNDKPTITADPSDPSILYVIWSRELDPDQTSAGVAEEPAYFSRTTDGGRTWDPPREIYAGGGVTTIGHRIVVQPDGELIDVFTRGRPLDGSTPRYDVALLRSADRGRTWSPPESISTIETAPLIDPFSTFSLQPDASLATIATVAADPRTGRLGVAWQDARFSSGRTIAIAYTASADGGRTWSMPIRINQTPSSAPAFVPTAAISGDGTIGVSYYDLRYAGAAQPGIAADAWLVFCRSACDVPASWQELHVAGSFDLEHAPYANGFFLGDYEGMIGAGDGFRLLDSLTDPPSSAASTSAMFVAVTIP